MMDKPTIKELGLDLLVLNKWQLFLTLFQPVFFFVLYFMLAFQGHLFLAPISLILMSYFTYGSTSHDLVHRNLGLSKNLNDFLLSFIEMISLRSGHAYKLSHLNHHKIFPHEDDIEGKASGMSFFRSLIEGLTFQIKIVSWALKNNNRKYRNRIIFEVCAVISIIISAILILPYTEVLLIYVILMIMGSWIIPLVTSYFVHNPFASHELLQTRLFRGRLYALLSFEHLFHLEHHLYPMVPHKNWAKLASRLDPYFKEKGIRPNYLFQKN